MSNRDRDKEILALRKQGLTYEDIAKRFGLSRQRIDQICRRDPNRPYSRKISEKECVYPNLRKWMTENGVSRSELIRRMGLDYSIEYFVMRLSRCMKDEEDPKKWFIDKMLEVTGMTYEQMFYREDGK